MIPNPIFFYSKTEKFWTRYQYWYQILQNHVSKRQSKDFLITFFGTESETFLIPNISLPNPILFYTKSDTFVSIPHPIFFSIPIFYTESDTFFIPQLKSFETDTNTDTKFYKTMFQTDKAKIFWERKNLIPNLRLF